MLKKAIDDGKGQYNAASLSSAVIGGWTPKDRVLQRNVLTAPRALVEF